MNPQVTRFAPSWATLRRGCLLVVASLPVWGQAPAVARRPLADLIAEARRLDPPRALPGEQPGDLVELRALEATLRVDLRYATSDNFLGAPIYESPRAFLHRPVAEALVRAHRALRAQGLGLRVLDAYRPWWVTKVFWEATDPKDHAFVADPAKGSVHNRACAVDLDLVRLADGTPVPMPSAYDEMSPRAHSEYPGGSEEARRNRATLRRVMEAEGFRVEPDEWWHFNHALGRGQAVMNVPFAAVTGRPPALARAGQVLRVITPSWDAPRGLLQRFERGADGRFVPVGPTTSVWIGAKGLAWRSDEGSPEAPAPGPAKREGDGRAPAGILGFGGLWGYGPTAPEGVRWPYRQATDCDRCVDDPDHPAYNTLQRLPSPDAPAPWRSAEKLRMETDHYRWLLVIDYNVRRPLKGAGSCIFLHVSPPSAAGTAGCTALPAEDLVPLLRWMDPAREPVLLQLPAPALPSAQAAWNLPPELIPTLPLEFP